MGFRKVMSAGALAALLATAASAAGSPAWRPQTREDLSLLLRCGEVLEAEIARASARLAVTVWTRGHQRVWRMSADMALIEAALDAAMDRPTREAARAALAVDAASETSPEALGACGELARRIHGAGGADGAPLPRMPSGGLYSSYEPEMR
ncbi:hypothetical protein [Rubrimonas cliftonensis]|uniref:Uncharacterized protein n=1 Tax=Rubrimonas cliftonensis TaxID=89524 RepID=A0A1H3YZD3_9RHOB|nr:hypothetical protein [Rubrimonas cliftonensis]SEA16414.1 hypothetical protein SAMN05444370_103299 [Rubrimonas cliftonensis]